MSYRIITRLNNRSYNSGADKSSGVGATVIPAERGRDTPVFFKKSQSSRILELLGSDSADVLEVIAYNTKYPVYVVAPHQNGLRGGVLMTKTGLLPFNFSTDKLNFAALPFRETIGVGNGTITAFSKTLTHSAEYVNQSVDLYIDGKLADLTASDLETEVLTAATGVGAGTGALVRTSGALSYTFTTAPAKGAKIEVQYNTNYIDKAYAALFMAFPCVDFLAAAVVKNEDSTSRFDLSLATKKNGVYYDKSSYALTFSLTKGAVNDSNQNIFLENLIGDDDDLLVAKVNTALALDTYTGTSTYVDFTGGYRGDAVSSEMLTTGWDFYKKAKLYPADIYWDSTADATVPTAMVAVRAIRKYKTFLFPQANLEADDIVKAGALSIANRGIKTFWCWALISNPYSTSGNIVSNCMGEIAAKYADALVYSYGGRAVAWSDENNVGGQLDQGRIIKMLYDVDEDQLKAMDKLRINPVYNHETLGYIVASRRSTDKSNSDYSYADYSQIIDYCLEQIENNVLPYQLIKFNDDTHRGIVKSKSDSILSPLTVSPNNVIYQFLTKCDTDNNGDEVLQNEEFVLSVGIKVTRKSEYIYFNFTNTAQGMKLEEVV